MTDTNQLPEPELGYIHTDKSNQPAFSARQMREAMRHALRPERVPMTPEQAIEMNDAAFDKYITQDARAIELVRSVEAHHGITAQAKKETP